MTREGSWRGERKQFSFFILLNENSRNDALKALLHNHKHFVPSLCVFKKNMAVTAVNCELRQADLFEGPRPFVTVNDNLKR